MTRSSTLSTGAAALLLSLSFAACDSGDAGDAPVAEGSSEAVEAVAEAPAEAVAVGFSNVSFTAEELANMDAVMAGLSGSSFSSDVRTKENAWVFLSIANTSEDETTRVAALRALTQVFTNSERRLDRSTMVDERYAPVVIAAMNDDSPLIKHAGINAIRPVIVGDEEAVNGDATAALAALAAPGQPPTQRYEALGALAQARTLRGDPALQAPILAALDAEEPYLISTGLFRLSNVTVADADKPAMRARLIALLGNADPGVQGRAAESLARMTSHSAAERDEVATAILPLLQSSNGFVICKAADALSRLRYTPAIPAIMAHIDSTEPNTYDIRVENGLDGNSIRVHHDGSAWSRIGESTQKSLSAYSRNLGERVEVTYSAGSVEEDIARNAIAVRAWFATIEGQIGQ